MAHRTRTRSGRKKQGFHISPSLIILGAALLIIVAIAAMVVISQNDETNLIVVPDNEWMPQAADFTPEFTLGGLDGQEIALSDYRGKYVLVNFWATWCPPCRAEMPDLQAFYNAHQDRNFTLLAVNVAEDLPTVVAFLETQELDFPVVLDSTSAVYERYGGNGLPSSYLIDPAGRLIKAWRPGAITPEIMAEDITPLLRG